MTSLTRKPRERLQSMGLTPLLYCARLAPVLNVTACYYHLVQNFRRVHL